MTRRQAIIGGFMAAIVFVSTFAREMSAPSQWPPIVSATAAAANVFVLIWFFIPLIAWIGSVVLGRLLRAFRG